MRFFLLCWQHFLLAAHSVWIAILHYSLFYFNFGLLHFCFFFLPFFCVSLFPLAQCHQDSKTLGDFKPQTKDKCSNHLSRESISIQVSCFCLFLSLAFSWKSTTHLWLKLIDSPLKIIIHDSVAVLQVFWVLLQYHSCICLLINFSFLKTPWDTI